MTYEDVTLSLPTDLVGRLHMMARDRDESVDALVRGMLDREATRLRTSRATMEARENRAARLRQLLAPDIGRANGWDDLQSRLALYGVQLKDAAGGLMLHDLITREPLCSSAALGFASPDLVQRFGGPMAQEPTAA